MSEARELRGIVVAHGAMAQGLIDAVRRIAGNAADALMPLSNDGLSPADLQGALAEAAGEDAAIVFVDLLSGSCAMAALVSARKSNCIEVVCGVNLPILLDFVFHRDMAMEELVPRLVGKGRDGIKALPEPA